MKTRFGSLLGTVVILTAWFVPGVCSAAASPRPNVLLIISDDHGWSDYGFMGHAEIRTPALDRLARESVVFERGYSPVPLCRPALASIVTGLYPHQHGVTGNDPDLPDKTVNPQTQRTNPRFQPYYEKLVARFASHPNFIRDLTARGYVALQTGKWWEGDPVKTAGFTHAMTRGEGKGGRHGDAGLAIGREGLAPIYDFIRGNRGKPFVVWYAPMLPHAPHNPPPALLERFQKPGVPPAVAAYRACVAWFDQTCGDLLDFLERENLRTNTLIFYTADNGWVQDPDKPNRPAPRSKLTPYEGGVRTPLMISWLGQLKPRRDRDHLASNVDIWPTLAALLQIEAPDGLPGINLTDVRAVRRRQHIFGEHYPHNVLDVEAPTRGLEHRFVLSGRWKLILPASATAGAASAELFDLKKDPWELRNLAAREPKRVQELIRVLDHWWPGP